MPPTNPASDTENLDYAPSVTREDVLRVIRREFPSRNPDRILKLLDEYGTRKWHPEKDRVHLAILKVSDGDVKRLRQNVETAQMDYRDVICPAEYPRFWKAGLVGASRMKREEVDQLKKDDWQQYETWLNRK